MFFLAITRTALHTYDRDNHETQSQLIMKLHERSVRGGVSYNMILLIKYFTKHTSLYDTTNYQKVVEEYW